MRLSGEWVYNEVLKVAFLYIMVFFFGHNTDLDDL